MSKWERINTQRNRRKNNYPSFDRAIDLHFQYDTPNNKEDLEGEMERYGFHVVDNEKQTPTEKQLNHAWEYILKKYLPKQKEITDYRGSSEVYGISNKTKKPNYRYRANRNFIYKGKKYKKGQFISQTMLEVD